MAQMLIGFVLKRLVRLSTRMFSCTGETDTDVRSNYPSSEGAGSQILYQSFYFGRYFGHSTVWVLGPSGVHRRPGLCTFGDSGMTLLVGRWP